MTYHQSLLSLFPHKQISLLLDHCNCTWGHFLVHHTPSRPLSRTHQNFHSHYYCQVHRKSLRAIRLCWHPPQILYQSPSLIWSHWSSLQYLLTRSRRPTTTTGSSRWNLLWRRKDILGVVYGLDMMVQWWAYHPPMLIDDEELEGAWRTHQEWGEPFQHLGEFHLNSSCAWFGSSTYFGYGFLLNFYDDGLFWYLFTFTFKFTSSLPFLFRSLLSFIFFIVLRFTVWGEVLE